MARRRRLLGSLLLFVGRGSAGLKGNKREKGQTALEVREWTHEILFAWMIETVTPHRFRSASGACAGDLFRPEGNETGEIRPAPGRFDASPAAAPPSAEILDACSCSEDEAAVEASGDVTGAAVVTN